MATTRVEIPISFQYKDTSGDLKPVPTGTAVSITDRTTHAPATVYSDDTTTTGVIASPQTDAGGNILGWVVQGSYTLTAAANAGATPPYAGAVVAWEAVRGDGVANIAPGAVNAAAIAPGAVGLSALDPTTVMQALLPTGTILDFGGVAAPAGFVLCDGTGYSTVGTYAGLYAVLGYTYGGSAGTFKVPDLRGVTTIGAGAAPGLSARTRGATILGAEGHAHSVAGIDHLHSVLGIDHLHSAGGFSAGHAHSLSGNGGAQFRLTQAFGLAQLFKNDGGVGNFEATRLASISFGSGGWNTVDAATPWTPLIGTTDYAGVGVSGSSGAADRSLRATSDGADRSLNTTAAQVAGNSMQPSVVTTKIIKI